MLLDNVVPVGAKGSSSIEVAGSKITAVESGHCFNEERPSRIDFSGAAAFPGLVNSHDHLDFNCFAPFGKNKYRNYTEWGGHIHKQYKNEIQAVLEIPNALRVLWGMYKNLLSGVTTVVNHGARLSIINPLITVHQPFQSLHSVAFEKIWKWKLNNPLYLNRTCVIHTGEGTDKRSQDEVGELLRYNFLRRKLIGVHGVAMTPPQAKRFFGLVWCPESNEVLLGAHAAIEFLKKETQVVFGTDSTLTGEWNIWQHLRLARSLNKVADEELVSMVTTVPAKLWNLNGGRFMPGSDADIVIARTHTGEASASDFLAVNPEDMLMVMHRGKIRMFDESMLPQLNERHIAVHKFSRIKINGIVKFMEGNLPALISNIKAYNRNVQFPVEIAGNVKSYSYDQGY